MSVPWWVMLYLAIGAGFGWRFAISYTSWFVLALLWPLFGLLMVLAGPINWWINRRM